ASALLLSTRQILALGSVHLPFAPLTGLLEVLMTTEIRHDPGLFTLLLETTQGALEGLAFLHPDSGQELPPSLPCICCWRYEPWITLAPWGHTGRSIRAKPV